ncbi:hypothetical protein G7Z17_g220 [Cylindrodendrum hubeiense]|uniref:Uncharacterized protein n=1 Tax=Cylindrodendrum hubeiense TaxID=595255 RepID=A0A9P5HLX9_9HYPO|nr:hypothetical protein G7Z17_g220 [Cylindrodendrum hubeiense]
MSIVRPGLLRKLYDDAQEEAIKGTNDTHTKCWAFWQILVAEAIGELNTYSVTSVPSFEASIQDTGITVERYDEDLHTLTTLLCVRCQPPDTSIEEIEQTVLDAARSHIQKDNLEWIWAMTTIGVSFRMWFIDKDALKLVPMHGMATEGDEPQYVDANSPEASIFYDAVRSIKAGLPLSMGHSVRS